MAAFASPALQAQVGAFIGRVVPAQQLAEATETVASLAYAYTRGRGFLDDVPAPSVARVIITATARLLANPAQIEYAVGSVAFRGAFDGWNPLERTILNSFRGTAR